MQFDTKCIQFQVYASDETLIEKPNVYVFEFPHVEPIPVGIALFATEFQRIHRAQMPEQDIV